MDGSEGDEPHGCRRISGAPSSPAKLRHRARRARSAKTLAVSKAEFREQRGMRDRALPSTCDAEATAAQSRSDRNSSTILLFVTHCRRLSNAVTATNVSDPRSLSAGDLPCQLCPLEEIHSDQQRVSVNQAALLLLFRCFNLELLGKVDGAAKRGRCEPAREQIDCPGVYKKWPIHHSN